MHITGTLLDHFIVIPHYNLLFCTIDKNANTLLAHIAAKLMKKNPLITSTHDMTNDAVRLRVKANSKKMIMEILQNTSWKKLLIYRDPVERFVSAYSSKCEECHIYRRGDGCYNCQSALYLPRNINVSMEQVANQLKGISLHNPHWIPQHKFCGDLKQSWFYYDHIIPMSSNSFVSRLENALTSTISNVDMMHIKPFIIKRNHGLIKQTHDCRNISTRVQKIVSDVYKDDYEWIKLLKYDE